MKEFTRDSIARHLFGIMNGERFEKLRSTPGYHAGMMRRPPSTESALNDMWKYYVEHGWDAGYLRLADEIVSKGYKP